ncbi:hypothetical protein SBF1_2180003 [Candidatus Desulfosporosinus infrequens]|uniref:Uncharacterized protein n=1 Tax=Candidatus Desulfosporosinus infrequens TaxID=2043169 RepID=A0A2U3KKR9_9FIRM|nr:hypothetical protein SBF1_2180003 [Candidatus Desulfosporosinus infrequens]
MSSVLILTGIRVFRVSEVKHPYCKVVLGKEKGPGDFSPEPLGLDDLHNF